MSDHKLSKKELNKERDKVALDEKYERKREGREERAEKTREEQAAQKLGLDE
jgi:hypothetical protein